MYYNENDILREKFESFSLLKDNKYDKQIEQLLFNLHKLYNDQVLLKPMKYSITDEINNIVIVKLDSKGKIKVNNKK